MEYKIIAYAAIALVAIYVAIKLAGQWAINKVVQAEFEHVLNNEEHKVKGRFG
jgi:hypothetical protein